MADLKREGKVTAELKVITADQVWPLLADFCNVHKWFPNLDKCYKVKGEEGKPGLIRYCASPPQPSFAGTDGKTFSWAKEKLVMIDPMQRCLGYEIFENNTGMKSCVATFQVLPVDGGDGGDGCRIEWSFVADSIEGMRFEDFESLRNSLLQLIVKNIQTLVSASS